MNKMTAQKIQQQREMKDNLYVLTFCPYGKQDICKDNSPCPEQIELCPIYSKLTQEIKPYVARRY